MYFSTDNNHTILMFREWKATSIGAISGSFVAVVALAVLYECLKGLNVTLRVHLNCQSENSLTNKIYNLLSRLEIITQFSKTCLFVTELSFAYFLMLIAMTYNTWFFVAVVIGRGLGYFLVTPLIGSHIDSKETGVYYAVSRDFSLTRRKRQPLIDSADI